jgi:cell division GTPase FtsZ
MRFLTIGLGHCGGKIASAFKATAMKEQNLIMDVCAINTDKTDLASHQEIPEENKLLVGSGKGAAKDWNEGFHAGSEARNNIHNMIRKVLRPETDIVMLTLGEGGGSGSGLAPVVAEIVGDIGRDCIVLSTLPFQMESVKVKVNAAKGLDLLYREETVKALILIDNDKIVAHYPDKVLTDAYSAVNKTAIDTSLLQHSWEGSLFAEADLNSAAGALLGVYGPSGMFTTMQVDNARRVFKEMLAGKDSTLGLYPVEHCRWISYVGIVTGLDVPQKVKELLSAARGEYKRHEEVLETRKTQKVLGLGFDLYEKPNTIPQSRTPTTPERTIDIEAKAASAMSSQRDISWSLHEALNVIKGLRKQEMTEFELVETIQRHIGINEEAAAACILHLKAMGNIIQPRIGILKVI